MSITPRARELIVAAAEAAADKLAEDIVGHPLPGSVKLGGNLDKLRGAGARA